MGKANLQKRIIAILLGSAAVYTTLVFVSDASHVLQAISSFPIIYFPFFFGLTIINDVLRFVKWEYYLRMLHIKLPIKTSLQIFLSGFSLTVTPGKIGEFFKAYLVTEASNVPVSRVAPVVVAERFTDILSLLILGSAVFLVFPQYTYIFFFLYAILFILILTARIRSLYVGFRGILQLTRLEKLVNLSDSFYSALHDLFTLKGLVIPTLITIPSWFCECFLLYWLTQLAGFNVDILTATFIYVFSLLAGALSMIPGGIGVAEGSLTSLLTLQANIPIASSAAIAIVLRTSTLWFGVVYGTAVFVNLKISAHPSHDARLLHESVHNLKNKRSVGKRIPDTLNSLLLEYP